MKNNILDRNILPDVIKSVELGKITCLLGSRQVGKTSLMKLAVEHFSGQGYTCFYLDMDDSRNIPIFETIDNLEAFMSPVYSGTRSVSMPHSTFPWA